VSNDNDWTGMLCIDHSGDVRSEVMHGQVFHRAFAFSNAARLWTDDSKSIGGEHPGHRVEVASRPPKRRQHDDGRTTPLVEIFNLSGAAADGFVSEPSEYPIDRAFSRVALSWLAKPC
jgi:hypothetical protein